MSNKFKILHILFPANNFTMTRTILTPSGLNENVEYYCILSSKDMIRLSKKKHFKLYENVNFISLSNTKNINTKIESVKPDAILLSNSPNNRSIKVENIPIFYVHHGIFNHSRGSEYKRKIPKGWGAGTSDIFLCSDLFQYNYLGQFKTGPCYKISGLPQFDLIYKLKDQYPDMKKTFLANRKLPENTPIILLIGSHYGHSNIIYKSLLSLFRKHLPNSQIIYKAKFASKIHVPKSTTYLIQATYNFLIQEYFFADIIVVADYGTSYIESLLVNPKTILVDPRYNNIHNAPLVFKNSSKLDPVFLNIVNDEYYNSTEFTDKVNQYLEKILGENCGPVSDDILSLILDIQKK